MKLPSIHSLLNPPPSPPTPVVQVMPASPTPGFQAERDPPQTSSQWPSPMLSPALSSSRSPSVCSMGPPSPIMTQQSTELPPIHGDDPPRPLSRSPMMHPKPYLHSDKLLHRHQHASHQSSSLSPPQPAHYGSNSSISPLLSPQSHPQHNYHQRHRSWSASNAYEECQRRPPPTNSPHLQLPPSALPLSFSSSSPRHLAVPGADTPSMPSLQRRSSYSAPLAPARRAAGGVKKVSKPNAKPAALSIRKESAPAPPPCTEILISPTTGQPILKRRRGRPPTRSPGYDEGGWTFLSPTVWNVTTTANPSIPPSSLASTNTSSSASDDDDDGHMTDAMTAFTGADMDTVLPMPKKKRGRKPKTHIEGNSCFVWKDITASKRAKSC